MKKINIFSLASKNLRRKMGRTLVLLLIVAMVTGTLLGATIFMTGMKNALKIGTYRLGADILVVPAKNEAEAKTALLAGEPTSFTMERSVYEKVKQVDGVKQASPQLFIQPASFSCCFSVESFLVAFDPKTDFTVTPWLEKNLDKPLSDDEVIAGREIPVVEGTVVPFFGTPFTVAATMAPTGMQFFDKSIFMTMDAAYTMAKNSKERAMQPLTLDRSKISAVLVRVNEDIAPDRVAIRIEHAVDGVRAIASDQVVNTVRRQLGGLLHGILVISGVLWILALLMVGFAFCMIVNERRREIGLLRSMGAKVRHVFNLIVLEAVMISIGGGVLGIGVASGLLFALKDRMVHSLRLPYILPPPLILAELVGAALVLAALTGLLASLGPGAVASRMEPYEAIRKGE
jgi:putative ABC transport system permease protein